MNIERKDGTPRDASPELAAAIAKQIAPLLVEAAEEDVKNVSPPSTDDFEAP